MNPRRLPRVTYWLISVALLLWALGGTSIYVAYFIESPAQFAQTAETAANRAAYADYIANIPAWALTVGIVAAATRLAGAVGLLVRRRWALPFFVVSAAFFVVALARAFLLAGVADVMGGRHIATEFVFLALSLFAIWFAHRSGVRGLLR